MDVKILSSGYQKKINIVYKGLKDTLHRTNKYTLGIPFLT